MSQRTTFFVQNALGQYTVADDDQLVYGALAVLRSRMREPGQAFSSPGVVRSFLSLRLGHLPHEVFAVLFLDSENCLIAFEEMFRGTLTRTSVYPREVALAALKHGAASVVLAHNHPSFGLTPSRADEALTQNMKAALSLVDVHVLDHIIIGGDRALSMAEQGLL